MTKLDVNPNLPTVWFPQPDGYPLSTSIVGYAPTGQIKGTTEEFMPQVLHEVKCQVESVAIKFIDLKNIDLSVSFSLEGIQPTIDRLYEQDNWKRLHLRELLEESSSQVNGAAYAPVLTVFPPPSNMIVPSSIDLQIGSDSVHVMANHTAELVALPISYPPETAEAKPEGESYVYLWGKASVIYAPLVFGKPYVFSMKMRAINFQFDPAFLFPYGEVFLKSVDCESEHPLYVTYFLLNEMQPLQEDAWPPKQEYNWRRRTATPGTMRPAINPADPYRNQLLVGNPMGYELLRKKEVNRTLKQYAALQLWPHLGIGSDGKGQKVIVYVEVTESPMPVRIYEQFQDLPAYQNTLIQFDVLNFDESSGIDVEISSIIEGYTSKEISNHHIPANGSGRSSRILINQCPKLLPDSLEKIFRSQEAVLSYEIKTREGTTIQRGSKKVKLLARDMIVWSMNDPRGLASYDLSLMIAAWISPTDEKRVLDRIRGAAKKYHPDGILVGQQGDTSLIDQTLQVKALYDYLNNETNIRYVNQPFSFSFGIGGAQRVLTATEVVEAEAGNCIDLVVLFSSLMEGLGINPLIMLTKNHAFLGWGSSDTPDQIELLECTVLGLSKPGTTDKYSFEEAQQAAQKTFEENFMMIGADRIMPNSILQQSKGSCIIDLAEVRGGGIHAKSSRN